mmetsp:Transcript_24432/g.38672  ORF Transcript_24432/g.38672 Transcript_24432/m.38672 type:complete len:217 (-) Transcript_24432:252-902(-)
MLFSIVLSLVFGVISAQDQCDPSEYAECGNYVESLGYATTCDSKSQCRDCIGCNQACPWVPCTPSISCSSAEYIEAGNYISDNKDTLGWLKLCCEASSPASKKCVGCQQANIFNILCGWVYPPLKASLGYSAGSAPLNPDVHVSPWQPNGAQNKQDFDALMFGVQFMGIGTIIGMLLTLVPIATIYCLCKQGARLSHKYKKVSCLDSEDDAQRLRV